MVAAAIGGAAVIGAVGSYAAADKQASGAKTAANTQQNMFDTITANSQPYMAAGAGATSTLSQLLGTSGAAGSTVGNTGLSNGYLTSTFNPTQASLDQYPGYQFEVQQGGQATRNADTPGVGALSGAALKDLTNFDVDTAATYYNQDFNQTQTQQSNIFSRLSTIAGLGQSAAAGVGNSGTQLGTGIASSQAGAATSEAAGTVGATNALSGGASSLAGLMYLNQNTGNPYASAGLTGNNSTGYTYTNPSSVGPQLPTTGGG